MNRRQFIASAAISTVAASELWAVKKQKPHVSVQLYSVRADMVKDPVGTLKALKNMGYNEVEHAAYLSPKNYTERKLYGYSAKELRKILDDIGLKMTSGHVVFGKQHYNEADKSISDVWKNVIEDSVTLGIDHVISPSFMWDKKQESEIQKGAEAYNRCGELCNQNKLRFGFHNHDAEFKIKFGEDYAYDVMLRNFDLKYVCQQFDMCNMSIAGVDPMRWLKQYPKHFESLHVKDRDKNKPESTLLGDGALDMKTILAYARKNSPIKYWVIEQESYGDKTPLQCVEIDLQRLQSNYGIG